MQLREELVGRVSRRAAPSMTGTIPGVVSVAIVIALASLIASLTFIDLTLAVGVGAFALTLAAVAAVERVHDRRQGVTLVVGDNADAAFLSSLLGENAQAVRVASVGDARTFAQGHAVREVVIAGDAVNATSLVDARGVQPAIVSAASKTESVLQRIPLEHANPGALFARAARISPFSNLFKRLFDLLVGLVIGILVLPLIPIVILAIKADSRGPVLYSQERIGLNGRRFRIFKFRSMGQDAERGGAQWAQANDPRVTRVGRAMRLTRIDELPQLWNVLRGDMTLVGPRPERPHFTAQLAEQLPGYDARHAVKPGLTGWAQVNYRYASSLHDARIKTEYDLYYVKHASLLLDAVILVRTVKVVITRQGQ